MHKKRKLMKDEEWLKRMKEQLSDYSEPAPPAVWNRLEKNLAASSTPPASRRVPFYRRWELAAAVRLLAVSLAGLWMLQTPLPKEVASSSETLLPVASSADGVASGLPHHLSEAEVEAPAATVAGPASPQVSSSLRLAAAANEHRLTETDVTAAVNAADVESPDARRPVVKATDKESSDAKKDDVKTLDGETTEREADVRRNRYCPSKADKYHIPVSDKESAGRRRWSLALALGNTGGFAQQTTHGAALSMQQPSIVSAAGQLDLSATSNGMLSIPEGQQVEFRDGIPYLMSKSRVIESMEHKQPVSVGVSVRKMLPKGFSLETGLSYTYLASDIVFSGHAEKLSQKLHYLGIPLRANWSFLQHHRFELYVSAGGAIEKCIYGKIGSQEQTVKPLQFSVMGAVGGQLNLSRRLGLYVEPGVSYFFDDGSEVETIRKENPCNFTLQGGIRFTY